MQLSGGSIFWRADGTVEKIVDVTAMTSKTTQFRWTTQCDNAFQVVKSALSCAVQLALDRQHHYNHTQFFFVT